MIPTCIKRFWSTKRPTSWSTSKPFGRFSFKWSEPCTFCTHGRFCTGIWNQRMFFCTRISMPDLVTWMFLKSRRKDFCIRRQAHPTTQVPKCGATSPTTTKAIFGRWAAFYMKCVLLNRHLGPTIWMGCIRRCFKESSPQSVQNTRRNWKLLWRRWCR